MRPVPVSFHDVSVGSYYLLHDTIDPDWTWALYQRHLSFHTCVVGWEMRILDKPISVNVPRESDVERNRFNAYPITDEQADAVVMAARHLTDMQAWHRLCERITQREDVT